MHSTVEADLRLAFFIILYNCRLTDSPSFQSLKESIKFSERDNECAIMVFDNSTNQDIKDFNRKNEIKTLVNYYYADDSNPGISVAYNHLSRIAKHDGFNWLVFLDQDTTLKKDTLDKYINAIYSNSQINIMCPMVVSNCKILSPRISFFKRTFTIRNLQSGLYPLSGKALINSGLAVSRIFFELVGGYNEALRLDFTDTEFMRRAALKTQHFFVIDLKMDHDFSANQTNLDAADYRHKLYHTDWKNFPRTNLMDTMGLFIAGLLHATRLSINFRKHQFLKRFFFDNPSY